MFSFEWPWILVLLPLPALIRWRAPARAAESAALRVPSLDPFRVQRAPGRRLPLSRRWALWCAALAWLCLVVAAARPLWLGPLIGVPVTGRDLMLAVDLSGSMGEHDFVLNGTRIDRLTATKRVARRFIAHRVGDRIGLILFGTHAYIQSPLTFDHRTVVKLLNEAVVGLAGRATAIGDAIGLAVKHLRGANADKRVLILMTDGANDAGELSPDAAARIAAHAGIKIFTIGIGADRVLVQGLFGLQAANPSTDLDAKALKKIASITGGRYFRARSLAGLEKIYAAIDKLEPIRQNPQRYRPRVDLFYWPLALAAAIALVLLALHARGRLSPA